MKTDAALGVLCLSAFGHLNDWSVTSIIVDATFSPGSDPPWKLAAPEVLLVPT